MEGRIDADRSALSDERLLWIGVEFFVFSLLYLFIVVQGVEVLVARQAGAEAGDAARSLLARLLAPASVWIMMRYVVPPGRAGRAYLVTGGIISLLLVGGALFQLVQAL